MTQTKTTRIDYLSLAKKVGDCILCNNVNNKTDEDGWYEHIVQGTEQPEDWNEAEDGEYELPEIYQTYIITEAGARELYNHTNETIGYNPELDLWLWYIHHFGTLWSGVHTDYNEEAETKWDMYELVKHF